jgi:hypothetical protein
MYKKKCSHFHEAAKIAAFFTPVFSDAPGKAPFSRCKRGKNGKTANIPQKKQLLKASHLQKICAPFVHLLCTPLARSVYD